MTEVEFDMVMEILLRAPIKSLLRFRCVSTSWNSLISSPFFIKNHWTKAKQLIFLQSQNQAGVTFSLHLDNDHLDMYSQLEIPIHNEAYLCDIFGSCNGVLCLSATPLQLHRHRRIVLWNPSIKKTLHLPPTPGSCEIFDTSMLGFGHDKEMEDYKVARVVRSYNTADRPIFQFYSLNERSWREDVVAGSGLLHVTTDPLTNQATVNVVIHWLLRMYSKNISALSFHLQENSFGEIMLPECFDDVTERIAEMSLSSFKDSLSFNVCGGVIGGNCVCQIWVMQNYGVRESWVQQYRVEMIHTARPMLFRGSGEILMTRDRNFELVSCDPLTQTIRYMGRRSFHADHFIESLVLLDRADETEAAAGQA